MNGGQMLNQIHNADVRTLKDHFPEAQFPLNGPAGFVDAIVTSPPYFDVIDYESEEQIGFGQQYEEYLDAMRDVFRDCHRISTPRATFWLIVDSYRRDGVMVPLPFELASRAKEVGWHLKDVVVWDKGKTRPWSKHGQFRNRFEYILILVKNPIDHEWNVDEFREVTLTQWWRDYPHRYSPLGKIPSNIWRFQIPVQGSWANVPWEHDCPFPIDLAYRMVALSTHRAPGEPAPVVLDPFAGSGTVLAVAEQMGCNYLGFELNPRFVDQFYERVQPFVAERWEDFIIDVKRRTQQQRHLATLIPKLRKTRFPKQLHMQWAQDIWKHHQESQQGKADDIAFDPGFLVMAYAIKSLPADEKGAKTKHQPVELAVVLRDGTSAWIRATIEGYCRKAPLTKFGMVVTVSTIVTTELPHWFATTEQVSVYENGKTWDVARALMAQELVVDVMTVAGNALDKGQWNPKNRVYPPIYTDVDIRGTDCDAVDETSVREQFQEADDEDLVEIADLAESASPEE